MYAQAHAIPADSTGTISDDLVFLETRKLVNAPPVRLLDLRRAADVLPAGVCQPQADSPGHLTVRTLALPRQTEAPLAGQVALSLASPPADAIPTVSQSSDAHPVEAQPPEAYPDDDEPAYAHPVEAHLADAHRADQLPAGALHAGAFPVISQQAEDHPAGSDTAGRHSADLPVVDAHPAGMQDVADTEVQRALLGIFSNVDGNEPEDDAGERVVPLPTTTSAALLPDYHDDWEDESELGSSGDALRRIQPVLEADDVNRIGPLEKLDSYDPDREAPDDLLDEVGVREDVAEMEQLVEEEDDELVLEGFVEYIGGSVRVAERNVNKEALRLVRWSTSPGEYETDTAEFLGLLRTRG